MRVKDLEKEGLVEAVFRVFAGVDAVFYDCISPWATSELITDILDCGFEEVDAR